MKSDVSMCEYLGIPLCRERIRTHMVQDGYVPGYNREHTIITTNWTENNYLKPISTRYHVLLKVMEVMFLHHFDRSDDSSIITFHHFFTSASLWEVMMHTSVSELRRSLTFVLGFLDSSMSLLSIMVRFIGVAGHYGLQIAIYKKSTAFSDHLRSDHDI